MSIETISNTSTTLLPNSNEQLIQSGFELIVKAFDQQEKSHQNDIHILEDKVTKLLQENKLLLSENDLYQNEIHKLQKLNESLQLYIETLRNKLNMVRMSVLEEGDNITTTNNDNNVHPNTTQSNIKGKGNQLTTQINQRKMRNTRLTKAISNTSTTQNQNTNQSHRNSTLFANTSSPHNEYYVNNNTPFTNKDKDYSDGDVRSSDNIKHITSGIQSMKKQYKIKVDKQYLEQLKLNCKLPTSLTSPNSSRGGSNSNNNNNNNNDKSNTSIKLTSSPETINSFLIQCKDKITPQNFEKILLLFNNHKSGLISSSDLITKIKEVLQLQENKYLLNLFDSLIIS
jgi:hypothetical protein